MNPRWLWRDYFDPRLELTRAQKSEIHRRAKRMAFYRLRRSVMGGGPGSHVPGRDVRRLRGFQILAIVLIFLVCFGLAHAMVSQPWFVTVAFFILTLLVVWVVTAALAARVMQPWYCHAMYELGYAICANCGYPLGGLERSPRCPECGWRKTRQDDPEPINWSPSERAVLRQYGYDACGECGGILLPGDPDCARCGEKRHDRGTSGS